MATPQAGPGLSLQVRRIFNAPRDRIFAAWTEREQLVKWMCRPTPGHKAEYLELDLRPGGRYRIKNITPNGDTLYIYGEYREIRPPEKLSFTWDCERPSADGKSRETIGETLVSVEFFERGKETEVILTHTGFTNAEIRQRHENGWKGCFDALETALEISGSN
jgi:uncharacterized protein YndB with AHSA1/START domain